MLIYCKCKFLFCLSFLIFCCKTSQAQERSPKNIKEQIKALRASPNFDVQDTTHIQLLNDLCFSMIYRNVDTVLVLGKEALKHSTSINYKQGIATSLISIACYYTYTGDTKNSSEYCKRALQIAEKHKYPKQIANANNILGMISLQKVDYPSSYIHFLKGVEAVKDTPDKERTITLTMNLGTLHSLLNDYEEALIYYGRAFQLINENENEQKKWQIKSNIAYLQSNMGLYEEALLNIKKSISYFENTHLKEWLAFCYTTKGSIYLKQNQFVDALNSFQKAKLVHENLQDGKGKADVAYGLASSYLGLGKFDDAEKFARQGLQMYRKMEIKTGQQKCYNTLYKIMENKNNAVEALQYLKIAQKLSDTIAADVNKTNLQMLRTKLQFENEKKQIELDNQTELSQQRSIMKWMIILLVGSLLFGYLLYNSNKRVKRLNKALSEKTNTLITNEMRLKEINTNQKTLFTIVGHDLKGPIATLRELLKLMTDGNDKENILQNLLPKLNKYTDHVYFTVDNLLSWGNKQMKGARTDASRVQLHSVATRVINLFSEAILRKNLTINLEINQNIYAWVDMNDIEVVFRNIVNNAIKFSHNGGEIKICATENTNQIVLQFEDQGVGISDEVKKVIFETNRHYSTAGTNNEKGTGMGLMLSKELLLRNKGKIEVKSTLNAGSTFVVYLPKSMS